MPRVSVIVPMYNSKAYLDRCVQSLLQQTFTDYEIVLVDDCSSDGTYEAALELQSTYPAVIRAIRCSARGRAGGARNLGIECSDGEWLMFVDSDDWVRRDYIEVLWDAVTEGGVDLGVASYRYVFARGPARNHNLDPRLTSSSSKREQMALIPSSPCSKIYRRSLFKDVRFLEGVSQEDMGVAAPLAWRADGLVAVNQPLYSYYQRLGSTQRSDSREYSDNRVENLNHLERLIDGHIELKEYLYIRELLGYRSFSLLQHNQCLNETWSLVEKRFPSWRSNSLLYLMPPRMSKHIDLLDHGHVWKVKMDLWIRGLYAQFRQSENLLMFARRRRSRVQ